ncbi:MAG: phosphoribosyltransferase family protein [bacterium]
MQLSTFFSFVLDALAPPRRTEKIVRTLSLSELYALALPQDEHTSPHEHLSILPYHHNSVAALVWEVKYYAHKRALTLAGEMLAETLLAIAFEEIGRVIVIPIPIHPKRRKERGHNQTELLCKAALEQLSEKTSLRKGPRISSLWSARPFSSKSFSSDEFEYLPDALVRVRHTAPQQGLPKHRRLKNVKNTMAVQSAAGFNLKDHVCVVVDDVATTGATFAEARRALKACGARRVYCVALAGT